QIVANSNHARCFWRWAYSSSSKDAADDATFGADRGAVKGPGLSTGHEGDDRGDLLGRFKAFEERGRADIGEEPFLDFGLGHLLLPSHAVDEIGGAFRSGRAGQNGVDSDAGAGDGFGEAASNRYLRGFGHAIVHHLGRKWVRGFAVDE